MDNKIYQYAIEFLYFGLKEARACIFPAGFFIILFLSNYVPLGDLARYDFIFLATVVLQLILIYSGVEGKRDVLFLSGFHLIGLILELFKTHPAIGSWQYPEDCVFKIAYVPLYTGFMYAAVASYVYQAWKILLLRWSNLPSNRSLLFLSSAIYINFFSHHVVWDIRWLLFAIAAYSFRHTRVYFTAYRHERNMPMILAFCLIGFFIWVAENISTFWGAWQYPNQQEIWQVVSIGKYGSWILLAIVCFSQVMLYIQNMESRQTALAKSPANSARW